MMLPGYPFIVRIGLVERRSSECVGRNDLDLSIFLHGSTWLTNLFPCMPSSLRFFLLNALQLFIFPKAGKYCA